MTQDEIIRSQLWHEQLVALAREAGFDPDYFDNIECSCNECNFLREPLERFAALVAAHERKKQAEQEPNYFGLTHDHTWLSIDKKQYDKLKPEGRMACYAAPVRTKDLTDDEVERALDAAKVPELPDGYKSVDLEIARAVIAADRSKNGII